MSVNFVENRREPRPQRNSYSPRRTMNTEREPAYPYKDVDIREGAYREVLITKIATPNSFHVRITEFEEEFKILKAAVSRDISGEQPRLFKGLAVAVCFGMKPRRDSTWFRGLVHDAREKRVELVDIGGGRTFHGDCIKRLDPKYFLLPRLSIKCSLTENEPFTHATFTRFKEDFIDCRFLAHFKKKLGHNHFLIVLLQYETLIGFDMLKIFVDKPVCKVMNRNIEIDTYVEVKLVSLPTDNEPTFYVRLTSEEQHGKKLLSELNDYYQKLKGDKFTPNELKVGDIYACEYEGKWFRARLDSQCKEKNNLQRFFLIDEGILVDVCHDRVKLLLDCFASTPEYAIQCCFDENGNWPQELQRKKYAVFSVKFIGLIGSCYLIKAAVSETFVQKPEKIQSLIEKLDALVTEVPEYVLTPNDLIEAETYDKKDATQVVGLSSNNDTLVEVPNCDLQIHQNTLNGCEPQRSDTVIVHESKTFIEEVLDVEDENIPFIHIDTEEKDEIELIDLSETISSEIVSKDTNCFIEFNDSVDIIDTAQEILICVNEKDSVPAVDLLQMNEEEMLNLSEKHDKSKDIEEYISSMVDKILTEVCSTFETTAAVV